MQPRLDPLRIASQTHTLANGLRVVAHYDASAPSVAVHLMYHAGSREEHPGRTGLAHLLEHLMFEGSLHAPKGEFDDLLERVGGSNNGSTWLDRTNYFETVPAHAVELALWLERERMAHFLPVLSEEMLELQRGVVLNERLQSCESRPYGLADERLYASLFPAAHPYSWPTIGYRADLEAITLADVRAFYEQFYTPRNAVLVLAGDLRPERAFALAERYFGDLPAGPPPSRLDGVAAPHARTRPLSMQDHVSFPRWYRATAVPRFGSPEWAALDVLSYVLADGESSRLQRALVRDGQLAQDADTWLFPTELHGVFGIVATARSGVEPARIAAAVERTLAELREQGATEEEVAGAVRRARRDQLAALDELEERAEELALAATLLGDAERLNEQLDLYRRVTPDELQRVAREYLAEGSGATLTVLPGEEVVADAA